MILPIDAGVQAACDFELVLSGDFSCDHRDRGLRIRFMARKWVIIESTEEGHVHCLVYL